MLHSDTELKMRATSDAEVKTTGVDVTPGAAEWFETIYADADGNAGDVPWADGKPAPALVAWLNAVAPSLVRCGARVAVVGCGLGDDARELVRRGYDVTAFDCSPTAISWAQQLDPANRRIYQVADLFSPPARWRHRFDLVVEINTLQAIDPGMRRLAMQSLSEMCTAHGHLLVICRHAEGAVDRAAGPPWPISRGDLEDLAAASELEPVNAISTFLDDQDPPVARMRGVFSRRR